MPLPLNLAMTPSEFAAAQILPADFAWMSCHFSPDGTGLTDLPAALPKGALLILDDSIPCSGHSAALIAEEIGQMIAQAGGCGLLLDFQRPGNEEAAAIAAMLTDALPCPVAVTPQYAKGLLCPVFLPPAPPHMALVKYLQPWRNREIWLEAALCKETITVGKNGTSFDPHHSFTLPDNSFFHEELCCRYTTEIENDRILFHLFDTTETLKMKLELAKSLGVLRAVGLYQELGPFLTGK